MQYSVSGKKLKNYTFTPDRMQYHNICDFYWVIFSKKPFTRIFFFDIIDKSQRQAGVAQSVAHLIGSEEVTGSIPVASFLTG